MTGICPVCEAQIKQDGVEVSEIIACGECSTKLEVVSVNKSKNMVLKEAPKVEEDWGE
ncbi:lysine biosynthesis protein LysW [Candidatus Gottesmanbacteria bacterium]|nr:lysine biosynthesis protein LysW [Candidatus Gottesmanbacteria bacterium]